MRAKAIGPLLGAATVVALLIPGAAGAKPSAPRPASRGGSKLEVNEQFKAEGTHNFMLSVSLAEHRLLNVTAEAPAGHSGGIQEAVYTLPAPQSGHSDDIKARIGNLGKIDVHFVAESTKKSAANLPGCTGGEATTESGQFVGQISFHGERGYTEVDAAHGAGTVTTETPLKCKHAKESPREKAALEKEEAASGAKVEQLRLEAIAGHGKVRFGADRTEAKAKGKTKIFSTFTAVAARSRGKLHELSLVLMLFEPPSSFLSPQPEFPTRAATIAPPAPFSGTGTFTREPGKAASWSGNLRVELPGFGPVPLAASDSRASMCEQPGCPTP